VAKKLYEGGRGHEAGNVRDRVAMVKLSTLTSLAG
jgi:hypothetical protein